MKISIETVKRLLERAEENEKRVEVQLSTFLTYLEIAEEVIEQHEAEKPSGAHHEN